MKEKKIRLSDELAQLIEQTAREQKISENKLITQAIQQYFKSPVKKEDIPTLRQIICKYPSKCVKCGRNVEIGEIALWSKDIGVVCADCFIKSQSDKAIAMKHLKLRELQKAVNSLKKMRDKYADELIRMKKEVDVYLILQGFNQLWKQMQAYPYQREYLKRFEELLNEAKQLLPELEAVFHIQVKPKKKVMYR